MSPPPFVATYREPTAPRGEEPISNASYTIPQCPQRDEDAPQVHNEKQKTPRCSTLLAFGRSNKTRKFTLTPRSGLIRQAAPREIKVDESRRRRRTARARFSRGPVAATPRTAKWIFRATHGARRYHGPCRKRQGWHRMPRALGRGRTATSSRKNTPET